ncbi:MAG: di-heme oxidoredictase family protein [Methylomonas sp.]
MQLDSVLTYLRSLQALARRDAGAADEKQGERLFAEIGCAGCHTPTLTTGEFPALPILSNQTIHPYTICCSTTLDRDSPTAGQEI